MGKEVQDLDAEAKETLLRFPFPGNVRQLRNLVEQAMILTYGKWLTADRFQGLTLGGGTGGIGGRGAQDTSQDLQVDAPLDQRLAVVRKREQELWDQESTIIREALDLSHGNKTKAADLLSISRYALQRRLKRIKADPVG